MKQRELLKRYTYVLEKNDHIAELKRTTVQQEKEYAVLLKKVQDTKEKLGNGTFWKCIIPFLLSFGAVCMAVICVFDKDTRPLSLFFILALVFLLGMAILIETISFAKHDRDKNAEEAARLHNMQVIPAYGHYCQTIKELNCALMDAQLSEFESQIPERYRTKDALSFFVSALQNQRADTEKELYNLYEEECYRRRMENLEQEKLQKLDDSLVHCPKCNSTRCRMVVTSKTDVTSFEIGDACCGYVLLGPIGLLCGACGAGSSTETRSYWQCADCGKKFTD